MSIFSSLYSLMTSSIILSSLSPLVPFGVYAYTRLHAPSLNIQRFHSNHLDGVRDSVHDSRHGIDRLLAEGGLVTCSRRWGGIYSVPRCNQGTYGDMSSTYCIDEVYARPPASITGASFESDT